MRNQAVQNWEELALALTPLDSEWAGHSNYSMYSPLVDITQFKLLFLSCTKQTFVQCVTEQAIVIQQSTLLLPVVILSYFLSFYKD